MVTPSTRERGKQQACTAVALGCGAFEGFSGRTRGSVRDTRSGRVGGTRGAKDASGASRALPRTREGDSGAGGDRGVSRVAKINRVPQSSERVREKDVTESAKRRFLSDRQTLDRDSRCALKMQSVLRTDVRVPGRPHASLEISRFAIFTDFHDFNFSRRDAKSVCWLAFVNARRVFQALSSSRARAFRSHHMDRTAPTFSYSASPSAHTKGSPPGGCARSSMTTFTACGSFPSRTSTDLVDTRTACDREREHRAVRRLDRGADTHRTGSRRARWACTAPGPGCVF